MTTEEAVDRILEAETAPDRRLRIFAALLGSESGLGTQGLTVVGGSAIEIYTNGAYVSGDIDLVVSNRVPVCEVLRRWGFKDEGKLWVKDRLGLFVDLLGPYESGSRRLTRIVQTKFGDIRLAAVEDLLLKRLREARYWKQRPALAQAVLLLRIAGSDLDWEYIAFFAQRDAIEDLVKFVRKQSKA